MNEREQRGMAIAAVCRLEKKGNTWLVPSQSEATRGKRYAVVNHETHPRCTCPDHEVTGKECKHIFAVRFVIQRWLFADGSEAETRAVTISETTVRKTYRQDWPKYNAAQVNEKSCFQALLSGLCSALKEPVVDRKQGGRPRIPMSAAVFSATFKVYSGFSGRRFQTDLREACEAGHVARVPHYNSVFNVFESEETTAALLALIQESARPLKSIEATFAVDSSGFSTSRFERWFDHKWGGYKSKRQWIKAHLMVGVKTNVITAVDISDAGDCPQLPGLLDTTRKTFEVKEVSADKAYLSNVNLQTIVDAGAMPYIPFKSDSTDEAGGLWSKCFHFFNYQREAFLARYHQRSNVESTFSMLKAKFGDAVRSKTDVAMKNEVLAKCLCHNICCLISAIYELGMSPVFAGASAAIT